MIEEAAAAGELYFNVGFRLLNVLQAAVQLQLLNRQQDGGRTG